MWLSKLHFQKIQWDGKCIIIRVKLKLTFPVVQCHIPDMGGRQYSVERASVERR